MKEQLTCECWKEDSTENIFFLGIQSNLQTSELLYRETAEAFQYNTSYRTTESQKPSVDLKAPSCGLPGTFTFSPNFSRGSLTKTVGYFQ